MKKIFRKAIISLIAIPLMSSCDVMDLNPTGWYGEDVVYSSLENMDLYVKGLYAVMYANADIDGGIVMDDGVSELLKYSWFTSSGQVNRAFYDPNYVNPNGNYRSNWASMYQHIRRLNECFKDINDGFAAKLNQDEVKKRVAEVRFLRAFAYQELVIRHGGVVLRVAEDYVDGPEDRAKARSTEAECWDFIINEYDKAAADLPDTWSASETGRITKGAAIGMKARAALYAKRWDVAIAACNDVFALNKYSLVPGATIADYNKIFTQGTNSEILLGVYYQQGTGGIATKQHAFNTHFCAPGDDVVLGATNANSFGVTATPSDEYASAFDIKVGGNWEAFDWAKLATYGNKPYENREVRFYASILYHGANWLGRNLDLSVQSGNYMDFATSGQDLVRKTTTGYVIRKFLSDSRTMNFTSILSGQYWIEMRLAEIYLIRSEAYARKNNFGDAYTDLNAIRTRVGLPALPATANWDDYLVDLSKERVCELGMEGHRYFDLVRWGKTQDVLNNSKLHGVKINVIAGNTTYERVECDTQPRLFPVRMNIFPIPYSELRNNKECVQNDVWK